MFEDYKNQTTLAKAFTILLAVFLTSLGLCGMSAILFKPTGRAGSNTLLFAGVVELVGMVISIIGLIIVGLIYFGFWIGRLISPGSETKETTNGQDPPVSFLRHGDFHLFHLLHAH